VEYLGQLRKRAGEKDDWSFGKNCQVCVEIVNVMCIECDMKLYDIVLVRKETIDLIQCNS